MYSVAQIAEMTTSTGTVRYLNYPNRRAHDMVSHDLEVEPGVKVGIYFDDILFDGAKVTSATLQDGSRCDEVYETLYGEVTHHVLITPKPIVTSPFRDLSLLRSDEIELKSEMIGDVIKIKLEDNHQIQLLHELVMPQPIVSAADATSTDVARMPPLSRSMSVPVTSSLRK